MRQGDTRQTVTFSFAARPGKDTPHDPEKARTEIATAQVAATQAVAAAIDRLAEAVENLQR